MSPTLNQGIHRVRKSSQCILIPSCNILLFNQKLPASLHYANGVLRLPCPDALAAIILATKR